MVTNTNASGTQIEDLEFANKILDLGLHISFTGMITFVKELQDVVKQIPLHKIMVETDAPYLAPEPFRGKCNEPSYVIHTAKILADLKNVELDTIAEKTTENFNRLFNL